MKYVIVTGWRGDDNRGGPLVHGLTRSEADTVCRALGAADAEAVIQGGAPGVDDCASDYAERTCHESLTVYANWSRDGRRAGPMRNAAMMAMGKALADLGHEVVVLAFPKVGVSRGTYNAIRLAKEDGLRVEVHEL